MSLASSLSPNLFVGEAAWNEQLRIEPSQGGSEEHCQSRESAEMLLFENENAILTKFLNVEELVATDRIDVLMPILDASEDCQKCSSLESDIKWFERENGALMNANLNCQARLSATNESERQAWEKQQQQLLEKMERQLTEKMERQLTEMTEKMEREAQAREQQQQQMLKREREQQQLLKREREQQQQQQQQLLVKIERRLTEKMERETQTREQQREQQREQMQQKFTVVEETLQGLRSDVDALVNIGHIRLKFGCRNY